MDEAHPCIVSVLKPVKDIPIEDEDGQYQVSLA
jgi:hypothetical protein